MKLPAIRYFACLVVALSFFATGPLPAQHDQTGEPLLRVGYDHTEDEAKLELRGVMESIRCLEDWEHRKLRIKQGNSYDFNTASGSNARN